MPAKYNAECSQCVWRVVPDQPIFWNKHTKAARHVDCEAAKRDHAARQEVKKAEAFHALLDRLAIAKGSATRQNIIQRAEKLEITPEQRLQLLLEASRLDTDATLEKVESLKSKAVKRRRLEETLTVLKGDAVPDELQAEQIALLEEALRTLDGEPKVKA
jgi:replication initiation and membrane attachment protein DnaB